jgi:hypothetical protein
MADAETSNEIEMPVTAFTKFRKPPDEINKAVTFTLSIDQPVAEVNKV